MYFPSDMTFQYFFFDTYPGYFLQVLPLALFMGIFYGTYLYRKNRNVTTFRIMLSSLFVCYMTGLIGLVLLLDMISDFWYWLLYCGNRFSFEGYFSFTYDLVPNFWKHLNGEKLGNILLFVPFGILYPLSNKGASYRKGLSEGFLCIVVIELLQPIFGRAFDVNDILLNTADAAISAALFWEIKRMICKK